jgi:hypothetical protein|tara:strand:+ start:372 stop:512 length:141 start_codon:yes stop_codon:yes gene_type:complete
MVYRGEIITQEGEMINFEGQDLTEVFLEMFVALEDKSVQRVLINVV